MGSLRGVWRQAHPRIGLSGRTSVELSAGDDPTRGRPHRAVVARVAWRRGRETDGPALRNGGDVQDRPDQTNSGSIPV